MRCNPKGNYSEGAGIGSILAAKAFAEKHGAVYWDFSRHVKRNYIKTAYLYDTSKKLITHKAKISIFDSERVPHGEVKYYPAFRKKYFKYAQINGWASIKMKNIKELEKPITLKEFSDHMPPRGSFGYGKDINPKTKNTKSDFEAISDEIIFNCLKNRNFMEKHVKEVLFTLGLFKSKVIDTEKLPHDERFERYDVFYRDSKERPYLVEIKKDTAGKNTLLQLKGYMRSLQKKEKKKIRGIILCKDATPELEKLARKEKIKIQRFKFSIDFGDLMRD